MSRAPPGALAGRRPSPTPTAGTSTAPAPKKPRKKPAPKAGSTVGAGDGDKPPPKKRQRKPAASASGNAAAGPSARAGSASRAGSIAPSITLGDTARGRGGSKPFQGGGGASRFSRAGTAASVSGARSRVSYEEESVFEAEPSEDEDAQEEADADEGIDEDDEEDAQVGNDEQVVWDREDKAMEKELEVRRRKAQALDIATDNEQRDRLNAHKTAAFNYRYTQRFVRNVVGHKKCSEDFAKALGAVAKVHVGELVETALAIKTEWGDPPSSKLAPAHLREAHRRYKLALTDGLGAHPRIGTGLSGAMRDAGPVVGNVRRRGPFGGV